MLSVINLLKSKGFCDGIGKPLPNFKNLRWSQAESNFMANTLIRCLCKRWALAYNRKKVIFYAAYIIRYSMAKMYAAKFRLGSVAKVFREGKNDLSRAIGLKKKSAIGFQNTENKKIPGILYDKYHKIPKIKNPLFNAFR